MGKVLVVDDDASMRRALERMIRLGGFDVVTFDSAEALLARGLAQDDACLVLDIDLPGIDGIACKRQLDVTARRLPAVFITALANADIPDSLSTIEPVAVLHKPFGKDALLHAIGGACRRAH